jgi:hypothetical protein
VAAAAGRRIGILCGIIFWIEFGLIALCAALLARHGLVLWIPIVAAIIVGIHYGCAALLRNWSFQRYRGRGMPADPQLRSAFIVRRICDGRSPLDNFLHFALANTSCGVNVKDMQRAFQRI